jgi:hypothetical protein
MGERKPETGDGRAKIWEMEDGKCRMEYGRWKI